MRNDRLNRRRFLALWLAVLAGAGLSGSTAGQEAAAVKPKVEDGLAWYDVQQWGVEGRGWTDVKRYFDRLPAKAEGVVRAPVWGLSRHSAGMCVHFRTDAAAISVRYELYSASLGMPHMPPTGVSGVDLYAQDDKETWRWVAVTRPTAKTVNAKLVSDVPPGMRSYMAYLPLYNGIDSLEIGVAAEAVFEPVPPRSKKPIVYYGTSIAHGACSSRPGIAFPSILGRWFDRPMINLAFSGNGRMDPEVGELLAELDPCVYCIDCLPNMDGAAVAERAEPLVRTLRKARPETPIVLIEDRTYANTWLLPSRRERHTGSRAAFKTAYENLKADGVEGLYYVEGEHLLGDDDEATTDSSHPSDLGMMRMAESLEPVLRSVLGEN